MVHLIQILGFFLAAIHSSLAALQWGEFRADQSVQLDLYHVAGDGSNLISNSTSYFSTLLEYDEERVKGLNSIVEGIKGSSQLNQGLSERVPLYPGQSIGTGNYFVKLGLGTPAKLYTMILDTGSSFSWLQCQPCVVYCHSQAEPLFDPSQSKTFKSLPCNGRECSLVKAATLNAPFCSAAKNTCVYTASYGDASFSIGYLSQDVLSVTPSLILPRFVYGCGQDNQGLFGRASGIIGLARNSLSLLAQVGGGAFSYCLPTASFNSKGGGGGTGFFSIGASSAITSSEFKFTPLFISPQSPTLYHIRLTAIKVAGVALTLDAGQYKAPTLIDSGTVITRLPSAVYVALKQAFVKIMSAKYAKAPAFSILDTCFKGVLDAGVPQIQMVFQGGADLTLGARNVMLETGDGVSCLAFASTNQISIVANHQQQTFKVAYDVSNSRIGFAAGGCL